VGEFMQSFFAGGEADEIRMGNLSIWWGRQVGGEVLQRCAGVRSVAAQATAHSHNATITTIVAGRTLSRRVTQSCFPSWIAKSRAVLPV